MATCINHQEESAASDRRMDCSGCQHSVAVRGVTDIVCLAYLSVRPSVSADECAEFEVKRNCRVLPSSS